MSNVRDVPPPPKQGATSHSTHGATLVESAYEYLLSMLMTVKITPGERIRIDAVARHLGISQTPIREALSQLEAEKLVYRVTNVGYRASQQMSAEEVHDLYTLRLLIEPYAAARAAERMDDEDLAMLRLVQADMDEEVASSGRGVARFANADTEFHRIIARGSGNRLIEETIERLHAHLQIFRSLYQNKMHPKVVAKEHQRIIAALLARDAAAAEKAVRDHLISSQRRMDRGTV